MKYLLLLIICIILLYFFLIFPRFSKKKQLMPYTKYYYAHRGLHNHDYPENTLAAFEYAKNSGYGIELDVQLTKDHIAVICHDFHLQRACSLDKQIDECTYDELKKLRVFNSSFSIPSFEEVLKLIDHKIPIIVEIKQKGADCTTCAKVCELLDRYKTDFILESFNPFAMNWFMKHRPQWIRGQLSSDFADDPLMKPTLKFLLKHLCGNVLSRPDFIAYDIEHRNELSFQILKHFIPTVAWTCRNEHELNEIRKDYDIVIFENFMPEEMK